MEFHKKIKLELNDYIAFNFAVSKARLIITPIFLILLLPIFCVVIIDTMLSPLFLYLIALIISIFFSGLMTLATVLLLKRTSKKQYISNKIVQSEFDYTIDNTGIHQSSEYGYTSIAWSDIYKASESKKGIFLFIAKLQAFLIPKRLLSRQEEQALRTIITANLDAKKNKLK